MNPYYCPRCRGPIDPGFRFCKNCGADLANPFPAYQPPVAQGPMDHDTKKLLTVLIVQYGLLVFTYLLSKSWMLFHLPWTVLMYLDGIVSVGVMVILVISALQVKTQKFKIFLWVFFGIELLLLVYRLYLISKNDF